MSGGSFEYLCFASEDAKEILGKFEQLRDMVNYLRRNDKPDAAAEVELYLLELETHARRIETAGKRMFDVLYATEWAASGDWNNDAIDTAYWKLMGMEKP